MKIVVRGINDEEQVFENVDEYVLIMKKEESLDIITESSAQFRYGATMLLLRRCLEGKLFNDFE